MGGVGAAPPSVVGGEAADTVLRLALAGLGWDEVGWAWARLAGEETEVGSEDVVDGVRSRPTCRRRMLLEVPEEDRLAVEATRASLPSRQPRSLPPTQRRRVLRRRRTTRSGR